MRAHFCSSDTCSHTFALRLAQIRRLTTVLLSRLLLNLREAAVAPALDSTSQTTVTYAHRNSYILSPLDGTTDSYEAEAHEDIVRAVCPTASVGHTVGGTDIARSDTDANTWSGLGKNGDLGPMEEYLCEDVGHTTDISTVILMV